MTLPRTVGIMLALLMTTGVCHGENIDTVKARMAKRLPVINAMKIRKEIGENNRGYLQVIKTKVSNSGAVSAENADRKAVYKYIARSTSSNADLVGKQRARQIAKRSTAGIMLQNSAGRWYEKGG